MKTRSKGLKSLPVGDPGISPHKKPKKSKNIIKRGFKAMKKMTRGGSTPGASDIIDTVLQTPKVMMIGDTGVGKDSLTTQMATALEDFAVKQQDFDIVVVPGPADEEKEGISLYICIYIYIYILLLYIFFVFQMEKNI